MACIRQVCENPLGRRACDRPLVGWAEAKLVVLSCSEAPNGRESWTMQLLADKLVELKIVDSISDETVRRVLKNEIKPWLKEQWCLPPEQDAEFMCAMEDVLDVYHRPYASGKPGNAISWRALLGYLGRLNRLKVFDVHDHTAGPMIYKKLLEPGAVSVVDLSDSGLSELNNIVIADLLRGLQDAQEDAYEAFEKAMKAKQEALEPTRTVIVVEEAHEFLSAEHIDKMDHVFEQVARIAKRGRKRWLGLMFVTQLPQRLPRQIFGLVNSFILHKISDPQVVATLRKTISGIVEGLWNRLPGLPPARRSPHSHTGRGHCS